MFGKKCRAQWVNGRFKIEGVHIAIDDYVGVHDLVFQQMPRRASRYALMSIDPPLPLIAVELTAENFDAAFYFQQYPDVAAVYNYQAEKAWEHWEHIGRNEGRVARSALQSQTSSSVQDELVHFTCNICGQQNAQPKSLVSNREAASCQHCHSSLRMRSLIYALSMSLFDEALLLPDFPKDKKLA